MFYLTFTCATMFYQFINHVYLTAQRNRVAPPSLKWLWYTLPALLCSLLLTIALTFGLVLKRRSKNGFWSREEDVKEPRRARALQSYLSPFSKSSKANFAEQPANKPNLELKRCNAKEERFSPRTASQRWVIEQLAIEN